MILDGKKVPLFSTHYSFKNREFLRVGNGEYAEVFVGGFLDRMWGLDQCSVNCWKLHKNLLDWIT